jgi:hypothetical protein
MVTLRGDGSCASDRDTASVDCKSPRGCKHLPISFTATEHDWSPDSQVRKTGEHVDNNGGESGKTGVREQRGEMARPKPRRAARGHRRSRAAFSLGMPDSGPLQIVASAGIAPMSMFADNTPEKNLSRTGFVRVARDSLRAEVRPSWQMYDTASRSCGLLPGDRPTGPNLVHTHLWLPR